MTAERPEYTGDVHSDRSLYEVDPDFDIKKAKRISKSIMKEEERPDQDEINKNGLAALREVLKKSKDKNNK